MIEALKLVGSLLVILAGLGGFVLIAYVAVEYILSDKRYDKW